jgi:hypothetical protein
MYTLDRTAGKRYDRRSCLSKVQSERYDACFVQGRRIGNEIVDACTVSWEEKENKCRYRRQAMIIG